ncbi:hypothetical protein BJX99DRAFT_256589 [Aspergillus californicus]
MMIVISLAQPSLQLTQYVDDPDSCAIIGDGDVYGIGVRLGYYCAWFSGLLAVAFNDAKAVRDARKGVCIISLAVLAILIRNTLNGSFAVLEWTLVLPMVIYAPFGVLVVASLASKDDALGGALSLLLMGLGQILQPWLYFTLARQGYRPGCEVRIFFFAYFDFYNKPWQGFLKAMAVLYCLLGSLLIYLAGKGFWAVLRGQEAVPYPDEPSAHEGPGNYLRRSAAKVFTFAILAPAGIVTIITGEKVLSGNSIDLSDSPLGSSSQLIPLIVGLTGLSSTAWSVTVGKYMSDRV